MKEKLTVPGAKAPDKKQTRKAGKSEASGVYVEIDLTSTGFDPTSLFDANLDSVGSFVYHKDIVAPKRQRDPYRVVRGGRSRTMGARLAEAGRTAVSLPAALIAGVADLLPTRSEARFTKSSAKAPALPTWLMPAGAVAAVAGLSTLLWVGTAPASSDVVVQQILTQNAAEKAQTASRLVAENDLVSATRTHVVEYTTHAGDTVTSLASRFHLSEGTIRAANGLVGTKLKPGKSLTILPVNGVLHQVAAGETCLALAYRYGLPLAKIKAANPTANLDKLHIGQKLVIPGASGVKAKEEPAPAPAPTQRRHRESSTQAQASTVKVAHAAVAKRTEKPAEKPAERHTDRQAERHTERNHETRRPVSRSLDAGGGRFLMPTVGELSSNYGWRWGSFHAGIDIAGEPGTTIKASRDGVVVSAGWDGAYGQAIVISHGGGLSTRYGHCSRLLVSPGQRVEAGQPIGAMGSTGRATGPHCHFEVMVNGQHVNPQAYL